MLTKTENKIMQTVYYECENKVSALISPADLLRISGLNNLTQTALERIMDDLYKDGYFDLIYSDRHGERVYCITLLNKGKAFFRGKKILHRNLLFRVIVSLSLAVLSFITGLILKAIF